MRNRPTGSTRLISWIIGNWGIRVTSALNGNDLRLRANLLTVHVGAKSQPSGQGARHIPVEHRPVSIQMQQMLLFFPSTTYSHCGRTKVECSKRKHACTLAILSHWLERVDQWQMNTFKGLVSSSLLIKLILFVSRRHVREEFT